MNYHLPQFIRIYGPDWQENPAAQAEYQRLYTDLLTGLEGGEDGRSNPGGFM